MLYSALIFGFLGSFHCIGMCGPIAFMLPVSRNNPLKKFFQILLYHTGRLLSYSIIGAAFGIIGKGLHIFGTQQHLSVVMGTLMITVVLMPREKFQSGNFSGPIIKVIGKLKSSLGAALKKKSPDVFFSIGFLNGFLPCGLVYMAVFGAIATAGMLQASLYMFLFGMGTIPLMTSVIYSTGLLSPFMRKRLQKLIPYIVVLMGLLFIVRGLGLGIPYLSPAAMTEVNSQTTCH